MNNVYKEINIIDYISSKWHAASKQRSRLNVTCNGTKTDVLTNAKLDIFHETAILKI